MEHVHIDTHWTDAESPPDRQRLVAGNSGSAATVGSGHACGMPIETESSAGSGQEAGGRNRAGATGGFRRQERDHNDDNRAAASGGTEQ